LIEQSVCTAEIRRLHGVEFVDGVEDTAGGGGGERVWTAPGECGRRSGDGVEEQGIESVVE